MFLSNQNLRLVIWDLPKSPEDSCDDEVFALWQTYQKIDKARSISIPALIESHADDLKSTYLDWIYRLSKISLNGVVLLKALEVRPSFSAWWMSLFSQKCNYKNSPHITDTIKLIALSRYVLKTQKFTELCVFSDNRDLVQIVKNYCLENEIKYVKTNRQKKLFNFNQTRLESDSIFQKTKIILWLFVQLIRRKRLRNVNFQAWTKSQANVTFFSYLSPPQESNSSNEFFNHNYWGSLPKELSRLNIPANYVYIYSGPFRRSDCTKLRATMAEFTRQGCGTECHVLLSSFIDYGILRQTYRDWIFLRRSSDKTAYQMFSNNAPRLEGFNVITLFKNDWKRSFLTTDAVQSLINLNLFECALRQCRKQTLGFYLLENQGWEMALLHEWRNASHGNITGVIHSTVRYWDLRYFTDKRCFVGEAYLQMPKPDQIAVNGEMAKNLLLAADFPENELLELEALRYQYLSRSEYQLPKTNFADDGTNKEDRSDSLLSFQFEKSNSLRESFRRGKKKKILVLTDYDRVHTERQLKLLLQLDPKILEGYEINVKTHPGSSTAQRSFTDRYTDCSGEELPTLLRNHSIAFCSAATSAAVDAYLAGLKVICFLDASSLNLSAVRGIAGISFVSTAAELKVVLDDETSDTVQTPKLKDFFYLNQNLHSWRNLFKHHNLL